MTFLDTNVCLDLIANREPWHSDARRMVSLHIQWSVPLGFSVVSIPVLAYLIGRYHRDVDAERVLADLASFISILDVKRSMAERAIAMGWADIEDALQHECAVGNQSNCIITRNKPDFVLSTIPVLTAGEWLKEFAG
jgi:predicted nucleic acid-binding protein